MAGEFGPLIVESTDDNGETQEDTKKSRKKRKAGEALFNVAQYLSGESADESAEKKQNPFVRAWNRLFNRIATVEEQNDVITDGSSQEASNKWLVSEQDDDTDKLAEADYVPEMELPEFAGELSINHDEDPGESKRETSHENEPEYTEADIYTPEEDAVNNDDTATSESSSESGGEIPPPETPDTLGTAELEPEPEKEAEAPLPIDMVSPHFAAERAIATDTIPIQPETIVERRANWGPAIVVGTLDYLRGRKLKRADREQQRHIQQLERRTDKIEPQARRTERLSEATSKQVESVRAQASAFEKRLRPVEPLEQKREHKAERQTVKATERAAELHNERYNHKPPEVPPPLLPEISPEVAPVVIMKEVEAAAEKNAPIEAAYEMRHEIKDEDSIMAQQQGAASVGVVLADLHQQTAAQHAAFSSALQEAQARDQAMAQIGQPTGMYKKAATSGFWAGVVITAILVVAGLVM
jgi:hypothetical protein